MGLCVDEGGEMIYWRREGELFKQLRSESVFFFPPQLLLPLQCEAQGPYGFAFDVVPALAKEKALME